MSIQVRLRGGTDKEHQDFVGADREVTVDTTLKILRVHDGITHGGYPLTRYDEFIAFKDKTANTLEDIHNDFSKSHHHDDKYSSILHEHEQYVKKVNNTKVMFTNIVNGYSGFSLDGENSTDYVRTTKNGLIPYQNGGYSNIGTSLWRFANGFFVRLDGDDVVSQRVKATDYIEVSGKRIYIGDSFPASARVNDILIQI